MPDVELKPCPFCGSKEIMHYDQPSQADDRTLWSCFCLGCQVHGPRGYTVEEAETAWNGRLECKHEKAMVAAHGYVCTSCGKYLQ